MIRKILLGLTVVAVACKVHGDKAIKVLATYVVDKTKPFASPAP